MQINRLFICIAKSILFFMISWILFGYLSGSILFARLAAKWLNKDELYQESKDGNPGTANAFMYGGFFCGVITLLGDLLKGAIPVALFLRSQETVGMPNGLWLVMAAPVIGHAFSVFYRFCGGKGIAVSFGSLIGLLPVWEPLAVLIVLFLVFSSIIRVKDHFHRTIVTYLTAFIAMLILLGWNQITMGFSMISFVVLLRVHMSKEAREKFEVELLWKH